MSTSVRAVVSGDWQRLRQLRLRALSSDPEAFSSTYAATAALPDADWQSRCQESEAGIAFRWFVAERDDGIWVGMALGFDGDAQAQLFGMWVAPQARGVGVAAQLCDACCEWAASRGRASILLHVISGNDRAVAAYRRAGFAALDPVRADVDGRGLHMCPMRRTISA